MAFKHGKDCSLFLDERHVSGFFRGAEFSADVDTAETSTFGNDWKTHIPGQHGATVELDGLYDTDVQDAFHDLVAVEPGSLLTVCPSGAEFGDRARLLVAQATNLTTSSAVGDAVAFTLSTMGTGSVGFGVVLAPLAAVTSDGSGTIHDGGAASTGGAVAHLHVTSVSASDDVDIIIEDDTSATFAGTPATIGTFSNVTAATSERIVIAGTVRRYVRVSWDVTGSDVSISFAVAFARL